MDLNFETVDLSMEFEQTTHFTSNGYDEVEFLISTNPGETPKPLGKIASGGELSRIMLALKTVLANNDEIETLIFDEIDTGISGRTAQKVSGKDGPIGRNHQVICITHLPQIAAMADTHFLDRENRGIRQDNLKDPQAAAGRERCGVSKDAWRCQYYGNRFRKCKRNERISSKNKKS